MQDAQKVAGSRRSIVLGATIVAIGVALVGTSGATFGSWIVLAGWIVTIYGLHAFGRIGPG